MKAKKNENTFKYEFIKENELENDLQRLNEEGTAYAEELALDHGGQNFPKIDSPVRPFLGSLTAFYNKAIGKIQSVLSSALSKYNVKQAEEELAKLETDRAKDLQEIENTIRLKKREKEKQEKKGVVPVQKARRWKRLRFFNFCVILLDIGFSSSAFMQMGYSLIFSMVIAFGIGVAIFLLSEHWPEILDKVDSRAKKTLVIVSIYAFISIVFYCIGYFRSIGLSASSGIATAPWYFAVLNLFFFTVVSMVTMLNKPNRSERKKLDDWNMLIEEIKEAEFKKDTIHKELERAREELKNKKESREKVLLYAISLEALVVGYYESACQHYCATNVQRRSDGVVPEMFSEEPPSLNPHFSKQQS